jgi:hypothetical protein
MIRIFNGVIPLMQNTPCKIAIFANGDVYEKAFFVNSYGYDKWGGMFALRVAKMKLSKN